MPDVPDRPGLDAEHFRAIADFTYDWETWVGPDGRVLWVNPAVERITGYVVAECFELERYPLELVYGPDRAIVLDVLRRARAAESGNHVEFRVLRKDGTLRWAAISWQPLVGPRGENLGYRSSVRDIDERKQLEQKLQEALAQAESASRAKSEFLANVSHELRTPLQSILGYAQLLGAAGLAAPLSGYVDTLREQSERLDRLVSDLLDYSSLQAGLLPLRSEPYSPLTVVESVVRALGPTAAKKGLWLRLEPGAAPERCTGDPLRVSQVLANLISNALKFTEHGGCRVSVEADAAGSGYRVVVDDTGPGLPADEAVFAPFRQGRSAAQGGVGLGLAISRQLCERMGGTLVGAESPLGGARFVARLPLDALGRAATWLGGAETEPAALPIDSGFAARFALSVLVVDDNEPAREFMHAALSALGYAPVLAASAEQALVSAERPFDLVLIDLQMPEVDGWSAARALRQRLGPLPVLLALTANALANDAARLAHAGFDGFVQKPIRLPELQAWLARAHERCGSSELDAERLRELHAVVGADGRSLLERTRERVCAALPEVQRRIADARERGDLQALGRALHDAHGLSALIGAGRAAAVLRQAEQALEAEAGVSEALLAEIDRRLRAVGAALALLAAR